MNPDEQRKTRSEASWFLLNRRSDITGNFWCDPPAFHFGRFQILKIVSIGAYPIKGQKAGTTNLAAGLPKGDPDAAGEAIKGT